MGIYLWGTHSPLDSAAHWVHFNVTSRNALYTDLPVTLIKHIGCSHSVASSHCKKGGFLSCATCDLLLVFCPRFPIVASLRPLPREAGALPLTCRPLSTDILEQDAAVAFGRINSPHHQHILQLGHSQEMSRRYLTSSVYMNPQNSDDRFLSRNYISASVSRQLLMYHFKIGS